MDWVSVHIGEFSGDSKRIVLGGDSAGGQISALMAAATFRLELAQHYAPKSALRPGQLRALVQHCSTVDFSVFFDKGFVMSLNFIRMLLPREHAAAHRQGRSAPDTARPGTTRCVRQPTTCRRSNGWIHAARRSSSPPPNGTSFTTPT
ncbi:alpha/beta hydrolase fold domain-containing protein [Arthrobacter alpinus]|uniref:alpha/beta hydrolase fold domain-containing protein n=1 Tax=Arthrobacter alpinus TaxID=656366 RepID=UPI001E460743|nr:alpha/beta hydrolase fold domain-containing protein [Arthrobacter alpinus]